MGIISCYGKRPVLMICIVGPIGYYAMRNIWVSLNKKNGENMLKSGVLEDNWHLS